MESSDYAMEKIVIDKITCCVGAIIFTFDVARDRLNTSTRNELAMAARKCVKADIDFLLTSAKLAAESEQCLIHFERKAARLNDLVESTFPLE